MKRNEKYNNNRGAALLSVMIAVTFITIVASALLYMAYMNFTMKAMSVQSKTNFYETEGYLQGVTVKLQDEIAKSPDPATTLNNLTEGGDYSAAKLLKLKYPTATGDGSSASVEIDGDTITLEKGGNLVITDHSSKTKKYTFNDVKITQVNSDGLTNNIKTDIVYYVTKESTAADAGGVGEFSMMVDGSLTGSGSASGFSFMTLYGNSFISDAQFDAGLGKTKPGPAAVVMSGSDKINIAGKYCVVYGDMILNDNSCFTVTSGNLCVYGDIYLNGNSTLICSGNIYMVGEALTDYGRTNPTSIIAADGNLSKHLYPAGLTINTITRANFDSFAGELKYNDNIPGNDGFLYQILEEDGAELTSGSSTFNLHYDDITNNPPNKTTSKYGMTYGWRIFTQSDGNGSDFDNRLTFAKMQLNLKDSSVNSTIISHFPVTYEQAHGAALKKIGPEAFKILVKKHTDSACDSNMIATIDYSDGLGHNYNGVQVTCGDFFRPDCDETVNRILGYAVNGEGGGTPLILSSVTFEDWVKDAE